MMLTVFLSPPLIIKSTRPPLHLLPLPHSFSLSSASASTTPLRQPNNVMMLHFTSKTQHLRDKSSKIGERNFHQNKTKYREKSAKHKKNFKFFNGKTIIGINLYPKRFVPLGIHHDLISKLRMKEFT